MLGIGISIFVILFIGGLIGIAIYVKLFLDLYAREPARIIQLLDDAISKESIVQPPESSKIELYAEQYDGLFYLYFVKDSNFASHGKTLDDAFLNATIRFPEIDLIIKNDGNNP